MHPAATVLLGTLYPLFLDALNLGKISVGPPYFDTVFVPVMTPILFLMGVAPFARWKEASVPEIARAVRWALLPAVVVAIVVPLIYGSWSALTALGLLLAAWIVATAVLNFVERVQHTRAGQSFVAAVLKQPRSFVGMHLAHVGIAVFVVGVTMVSSFQDELDIKMAPGDHVDVAGAQVLLRQEAALLGRGERLLGRLHGPQGGPHLGEPLPGPPLPEGPRGVDAGEEDRAAPQVALRLESRYLIQADAA